jgi:hypothetical protein
MDPYWSFHVNRSIVQVSLTGDPNPQIIVDSLSSNIGKVAYDWQAGNLYWTDSLFNKIVMTPLSQPDTVKTVVILDRDQPIGLALYPPNGSVEILNVNEILTVYEIRDFFSRMCKVFLTILQFDILVVGGCCG